MQTLSNPLVRPGQMHPRQAPHLLETQLSSFKHSWAETLLHTQGVLPMGPLHCLDPHPGYRDLGWIVCAAWRTHLLVAWSRNPHGALLSRALVAAALAQRHLGLRGQVLLAWPSHLGQLSEVLG